MEYPKGRPSTWLSAAVVWACAFAVYQTTFLCAPRLFLFPETGAAPGDIPEYAAALRGRPNDTDMRKHPLYLPLSRPLYRAANAVRLRCGVAWDTCALALPGACAGAAAVFVGYLLCSQAMGPAAGTAALLYASSYSMWLMSSVTETYALTALLVNLFLLAVLRDWERTRWGWLGVGALAALCALSDFRSLLLLVIPWYTAARSREAGGTRRIAPASVATAVALAATATGMLWFEGGVAGLAEFAAWTTDPAAPYFALRRNTDFVRTLLFGTVSPLQAEQMSEAGLGPRFVHHACAYAFLACAAAIVASSIRPIVRRLRASARMQGIALWLALSIVFNAAFIIGIPPQFAAPLVLPMLLLLLPGILDRWGRGPWGRRLLGIAALAAILNNLVVLNETREAWATPPFVLGPGDAVYLLPGETARLDFLVRKGTSLLPPAEPGASRARREALDRVLLALPRGERDEARDIVRRLQALRLMAERGWR